MAYDKVVDSAKLNGAMTQTANSIRSKTGSSSAIVWDETTGFKSAIDAISTGGGTIKLQEKTVTPTTSSQSVTAGSGYDGLSKVTVNAVPTQEKSATPTTSAQTITPDSGKFLSKVSVGAIPSTYVKPTATKAATTYTPTTSNQTIAAGTYCSGAQTIKGDSNLVSSNIKSGVSIFGVTGNFAGETMQYATGTITPDTTTSSTVGTELFSLSGLSFTPKFVAIRVNGKFSNNNFGSRYNVGAVFGSSIGSGWDGRMVNYNVYNNRLEDETYVEVAFTSSGFIVRQKESGEHKMHSSYQYIAIG